MKKFKFSFVLLAVYLVMNACSKKEEIDQEKPSVADIMVNDQNANCVEVKRGKIFTIKALLSDNFALGSFSFDIHHNFDFHSHSTEVVECYHEDKKDAINPFVYINAFDLTQAGKNKQINEEIYVPEDVDLGNYHFTIKVVDKMGWIKIESFSFRIIE